MANIFAIDTLIANDTIAIVIESLNKIENNFNGGSFGGGNLKDWKKKIKFSFKHFLYIFYIYPNGNLPTMSTWYFSLTLRKYEATVPTTTAISSAGIGAGNLFLNLWNKKLIFYN